MSSPAPPSPLRDHSADYYYFIAAVAVIALLLVASNTVVVSCCSRCTLIRAIKRLLRSWRLLSGTDEDDDDHHISQLIPASKYKKEQAAAADGDCSVCLMPLVEGEEVRQLPECKHSFHAPCIDMWLYSHSNCPMCRAGVLPEGRRCPRTDATDEETSQSQSRRSLIVASGMTGVVVSVL